MRAELIPTTLILPPGDAPRSEGVHLSGVTRCIAGEAGILKPEYCEDLSLVDVSQEAWWESLDPVNQLRIAIGLAWEQWYAKVLAETMGVIFHAGERQRDGIYMTPDGESLDMIHVDRATYHVQCLHELKATYKSIKTVGDLYSQWMWLAQMKGYCKGLDTLYAYLHVLFLCGDYSFPIRPVLKVWRIEFTRDEIDDNWELHLEYVRHRKAMELDSSLNS